jgi:uncharacterized repeat protein (TIGR03803 family)
LLALVWACSVPACSGGGKSGAQDTSGTDTWNGTGNESGAESSTDTGSSDGGDTTSASTSDTGDDDFPPGTPVPTSCSDYTNTQPAVVQNEPLAIVYDFSSDLSSPYGRMPEDGIVEGPDGNLYGVTRTGGLDSYGSGADGLVFRLSPTGDMTVLHTFEDAGTSPVGALIVGSDCALYGTTYGGSWSNIGGGTVFRITLAGELNYLVEFDEETGKGPFDRLVAASDGNIYGTTTRGNGWQPAGGVFKRTPEGAVTTLALFNGSNGAEPRGGLIEGGDGWLYGMTNLGGTNDAGTIFRVSADGSHESLWSFTEGIADDSTGYSIKGGLTQGADGNFYGMTFGGGLHGSGTIFRITASGEFTRLHSFDQVTPELGCNCGLNGPTGSLLLASDGNFYGVTYWGTSGLESGGRGAVFRMTPDGTVTPIVYFPEGGPTDSLGGLIESSDGYLYGTSYSGGDDNTGTVFRVRLD